MATLNDVVGAHLVSVGLTPIAGPEEQATWIETYRELLGPDIDGIETVTSDGDPNLEEIARIAPDLLVVESFSEDVYNGGTYLAAELLLRAVVEFLN